MNNSRKYLLFFQLQDCRSLQVYKYYLTVTLHIKHLSNLISEYSTYPTNIKDQT